MWPVSLFALAITKPSPCLAWSCACRLCLVFAICSCPPLAKALRRLLSLAVQSLPLGSVRGESWLFWVGARLSSWDHLEPLCSVANLKDQSCFRTLSSQTKEISRSLLIAVLILGSLLSTSCLGMTSMETTSLMITRWNGISPWCATKITPTKMP